MEKCNVLIVGGGPSGLFSAKYILENNENASVILIDKGKKNNLRKCSANKEGCKHCETCDVLCGNGGAGLLSDGKLILDLNSGGLIGEITDMTCDAKEVLVNQIKSTLEEFDGISEISIVSEKDKEMNKKKFKKSNLDIKFYDVLHMGTKNLSNTTANFISYLESYPRFKIINNQEVVNIEKENKFITKTNHGDEYVSDKIILGVGRTGSSWLYNLLFSKGVKFSENNCYIGVRVETLHENIADLINMSFDPKIWTYVDGKKVKIHCVCRNGNLVMGNYNGFIIVGGHTMYTKNNLVKQDKLSKKSSFNILVSLSKQEVNIKELLSRFVDINPNGVLIQKLGDFIKNNITTEFGEIKSEDGLNVKKSNIRKILDEYKDTGTAIISFLENISELYPKIINNDNLIYAPAVEWLMDTVHVDNHMETSWEGCFAVGDGAGLSQGIIHSSATGILAAKKICQELDRKLKDVK